MTKGGSLRTTRGARSVRQRGAPFGMLGLPDILRNEPDEEVVEGFDLEVADRGFEVVAADAAVVGEEDVGAAGEDSEEAAHELAFLGGAAAEDGDELDALPGVFADGGLKALDDALVVLVGGGVQDEEGDAGAGGGVPGKVLEAGFQGRMDGFGKVAATFGVLHGDVLDGFAVVVREGGELGHVLILLVAVEDSAGAELDAIQAAFGAVQDVHEVLLEEVDLVAHGPGGVHDEGDVGALFRRLGLVDEVEVHFGLLLLDVPGGEFRGRCLGLSVDGEDEVVRAGLGVERVDPEVRFSLVVGERAPEDLLALLQVDAKGGEPLAGGVRDADGHPARRIHPPVRRHPAVVLRSHQPAPEIPVGQVVPFAGGEDAGLAARAALAAVRAAEERVGRPFCRGIGAISNRFIITDFGAGNQAHEARQREKYRLFHRFRSFEFRKENPSVARTLHQTRRKICGKRKKTIFLND